MRTMSTTCPAVCCATTSPGAARRSPMRPVPPIPPSSATPGRPCGASVSTTCLSIRPCGCRTSGVTPTGSTGPWPRISAPSAVRSMPYPGGPMATRTPCSSSWPGSMCPAAASSDPGRTPTRTWVSPVRRSAFSRTACAGGDRWLKGIDNGIDREPAVRLWLQDPAPPATHMTRRPGRWIGMADWPSAAGSERTWWLDAAGRLGSEPGDGLAEVATPLVTGMMTGEWKSPRHRPGTSRRSAQRRCPLPGVSGSGRRRGPGDCRVPAPQTAPGIQQADRHRRRPPGGCGRRRFIGSHHMGVP